MQALVDHRLHNLADIGFFVVGRNADATSDDLYLFGLTMIHDLPLEKYVQAPIAQARCCSPAAV
jgi:hypothetical protein